MRSLALSVALVGLSAPALANEWLISERVAAGVNPDGSLCDPARQLCLMYDPDGPEGPIPLGRDLLLPGRAFEAWGVEWTHEGERRSVSASAPDAGGPVSLTWSRARTTPDFVTIRGEGAVGPGLRVQVDIDLPRDGDLVFMTHTWIAQGSIAGLEASRTVDNDPDFFRDNSYNSRNEAFGEVVVSASRYEVGTAIAAGVAGGTAAVCTSWCVTPTGVRAGVSGPVEADRVVGVRTAPVDIAAGATFAHRFVYALASDGPTARARAIAALPVVDLDGDGHTEAAGDCDDRDASVYPGARELPDGKDNDCNGLIDEGTARVDDDGDGFSPLMGDCDDTDPRVYPGAPPVAGVVDANCDGIADAQPFDDGSPPDGWGEIVDRPGVGCASAAAPLTPFSLLLAPALAIAFARRRRSA
jgi:hypothetical protein